MDWRQVLMISAPGGRGAAPGGRGAARGSRKARSCLDAVGALELDDLHRRWAGDRAGSGWAVGGAGRVVGGRVVLEVPVVIRLQRL